MGTMSSSIPLLQIKQLSRIDSTSHRTFFENFSTNIHGGDQILLDGVSGAGKSVLLRALAFLDEVQQGHFLWNNEELSPARVPLYRSRVHYVAQTPTLEGDTVEEALHFPWRLSIRKGQAFPEEKLQSYLKQLHKSSDFLHLSVASLSGGEKQLCQLLRTLLISPQILLLDEPTSALDELMVLSVEHLLQHWIKEDSQRAWVWVTHDEGQKRRVANRYWYMQQGQVEERSIIDGLS